MNDYKVLIKYLTLGQLEALLTEWQDIYGEGEEVEQIKLAIEELN